MDERWTTTTTSSSQWSGQSDYITPFPPPETDTNTTTWVVTNVGKPTNNVGQTIDYGGCNESYEMTSFNSDGISEGYRWYCPEVRNYAWLHTADDIGLVMISSSSGTTRLARPAWNPTPIPARVRTALTWSLNGPSPH